MSQWITGAHHIAIKPTAAQYENVVDFYTRVLGLAVKRTWGDPQRPCQMVSCGDNTCLEILPGEGEAPRGGALDHLAFATDHVDELIQRVRQEGYAIAVEPMDIQLGELPVRVAFCWGPMGEYIEFFQEK